MKQNALPSLHAVHEDDNEDSRSYRCFYSVYDNDQQDGGGGGAWEKAEA